MYAGWVQYVNYAAISGVASDCGFPASTVKASAPALDTCEGAVAKWSGLYGAVCPWEEGENDEKKHTPASCGNSTACKDLISSLDDCAMAKIKTGLEKCANDPNMAGAAQYAQHVSYATISEIAGRCGFPADTVKVSHPTGTSLAVQSWVPDCACHHAIWREFWDPAHTCPTWVRMTLTLAVHKDDGFDEPGLIDAVARAAGVQHSARVKVGQARISATWTGHTDVDISVRVPHSQDLTNASASIRDALIATEVEQTIGDAVGASVNVSEGPIIDEALTRSSFPGLQCSPGLQCGEVGCPKCVCDCSC